MNYTDPLGRSPGYPLDPKRHSVADLEIRKRGSQRTWLALWQQTPRSISGDLINIDWFQEMTHDMLPIESQIMASCRAWDLAYTQKEVSKRDPDFTVGIKALLWRYEGELSIIIVDILRWQDNWPTTKRRIFDTASRDSRQTHIVVESGGAQKGLHDELKGSKELRGFRLYEDIPNTDKVARAQPWIDLAENGRVFLLKERWNADFLAECASFDRGAHDDQVDTMSMIYSYLMKFFRQPSVRRVQVRGLYGD